MGNFFSNDSSNSKPFGMENYGNTCYMNSIFQVFLHSPILKSIWKDGIINFQDTISESGQIQNENNDFQLIESLIRLYSSKSSYQLKKTLLLIKKLSKNQFSLNDYQQDAHEFYNWMRERIIFEMPTLKHYFQGKSIIEIKCLTCGFVSSKEDPIFDLQIQIDKDISLFQCIKNYEFIENLIENNKFYCKNCQNLQNAIKQELIVDYPEILCIQLKRFQYNENTYSNKKLMYQIGFTKELRIPSNEYEGNDFFFTLFAVVIHIGSSLESGHYISIGRTEKGWIKFDDDIISEFDGDFSIFFDGSNLNSSPYMLFYNRIK